MPGRNTHLKLALLGILGVTTLNRPDDEDELSYVREDLINLFRATPEERDIALSTIEYLLEADPNNIPNAEWGVEIVAKIFPDFHSKYTSLLSYVLAYGIELPKIKMPTKAKAKALVKETRIDLGEKLALTKAYLKHQDEILLPENAEIIASRLNRELDLDSDEDELNALDITRLSFESICGRVFSIPNDRVMREILLELYPDEYYWGD